MENNQMTSKELRNYYETTYQELERLKKQLKLNNKNWQIELENTKKLKSENIDTFLKRYNETAEKYTNENLRLKHAIEYKTYLLDAIRHNLSIKMIEENKNKIIAILNKYNGKSLGAKTKAKIIDNLRILLFDTNIRFEYDSLNIFWKYNTIYNANSPLIILCIYDVINSENKLDFKEENIKLNKQYIEDVENYTKEIFKERLEIIEECEKLKEKISNYNLARLGNNGNIYLNYQIY